MTLGPTTTTLGLACGYLAVGLLIATALARRGQPPTTALSALAVWPLLLPLLQPAGPAEALPEPGPF
ncbi:MAG: hypothetical protein R3F59_39225, partial [Myxococcota bacterium]